MPKRKKQPPPGSKPAARPVVYDMTSEAGVISQPSVRTSILWTPALVQSITLDADRGDLWRLGELCDQMLADDRIGELCATVAEDVLGSDLSFEKDARSTIGDAEKAPELQVDWPIGYDDDELSQLAIWTLMMGIGFAKHEVWLDVPPRIVPRTKWWHGKHFLYVNVVGSPASERTWKVRTEDGQQIPIKAGDGTWIILTRRGEFRPWANGLWRELAPWWMLKRYAIQDWGIHSEKASKLVATTTDVNGPGDYSTTAEMRKTLARYIYEASKDAVIALPPGFDLKLIELGADTEAIYNAQIKAANEAFAIAILGQNLSTNVEGGSRAAAEVHERKENRKVRNLAKLMAKGLQAQSLTWWAEFNFGDRALAPYPRWHTEPEEDYAAKATGLLTLGQALVQLKTAGYKLASDTIEEEYGVVLEDAPPPEPQPMPGQQLQPGQKPQPGKQPPPPKQKQSRFLASGDDADTAPGFIAGQVYTDALTDKEVAHGADYLAGFIDRIGDSLEGVDDYERVRSAVLKAYADEEDPERLVELVEHGMLLANLAGRHAVDEDAAVVPKAKTSAEDVALLATVLLQEPDMDPEQLKTRLRGQTQNAIAQAAAAMLGQLGELN